MGRLAVLSLLALLAACTSREDYGHYGQVLDAWIGASERVLISQWGPPEETYLLSEGRRVIAFERIVDWSYGGYTPKKAPSFNCQTNFVIDGSGVIVDWSTTYFGTSARYDQKRGAYVDDRCFLTRSTS